MSHTNTCKKERAKSLDEIIKETTSISLKEYLNQLLKEKHLTKGEVIERSSLSKNTVYPLFNGNRTRPSKNITLAIAFAMFLNLEETNQLLSIADNGSLYEKQPRDATIIYCILHHYDLQKTDEVLYDHGFETIQKRE